MNLWIIHHYAMPPSLSGITRHFTLAKELQKYGYKPAVIAGSKHHKNKAIKITGKKPWLFKTYNDIPFLWLRTPSESGNPVMRVLNMLTFFLHLLFKTGFKNLSRPDVIMGCTPEPFAALGALALAKRYKVPFVLHIGDLWPLSLIEVGKISKFHPFILLVGLVEKTLYKHSDRIITPLPTPHEYIAQKGGNPDHVICIPNGVDVEKLPKYAPPFADKLFKVYFAGAHGPSNGLDAVLDAASIIQKSNKDIKFVLIGDGPEKTRLQKRAINENIKNVNFHDPVPKNQIYDELQKADAFIINYPDLNVFTQGGISPNKIFDYMGIGRPTIVGCSAPTNPVKQANAGITVAASNAQAITDAVLKLYKMPQKKRLEIGQNGRASVIQNNSFNTLGKMLFNAITPLSPKAVKS